MAIRHRSGEPQYGENASSEVLYGSNTAAALENFRISGQGVPLQIIDALAHIKAAAAVANATNPGSHIDADLAVAIGLAVDQILERGCDEQFGVDVFQTGSGTSTNMNVNEVIASLASRHLGLPVHPNDDVNASQSTNDTFPTAIRVAALQMLSGSLIPSLEGLERELALKARQFGGIVKAGRTHLMDATPITLGQEFGGYRDQVRLAIERLADTVPRLAAVPLGGTATGNGLNAPEGYAATAIAELANRVELPLVETTRHFAAQGSQDDLVEFSAQTRGAAISIFKIANDLRWLASGPETGLGELELPSLQPGSSIMPGKVNPVVCEAVLQVCAQVVGNDAAVSFAGTQGNFELNTFLPVIGRNVLESVALLASACEHLASKCVTAITVNLERCERNATHTPALATALNGTIGYDAAAALVRQATGSGQSIREVAVAAGLLDEETANRLLDVSKIARGSIDVEPHD